jgi:LysM repeat protein
MVIYIDTKNDEAIGSCLAAGLRQHRSKHLRTFYYSPYISIVTRYLRTILVAWLFAVALLFVVPQTAHRAHAQEGYTIYVVAPGDNLSAIASRYNISLSTLMSYNQISNANLIRPGQQIRIPIATVQPASTNTPVPTSPPAPAATEESSSPVTTSPGVPAASNSISGAPAGEASTAPARTPEPTSTTRPVGGLMGYTAAGEPVYTVRRGDTLSGIASQYGVTVSAIIQRNGLGGPGILVSQRLIIPLAQAASTPTLSYSTPVSTAKTPTLRPTVKPTPRPTTHDHADQPSVQLHFWSRLRLYHASAE